MNAIRKTVRPSPSRQGQAIYQVLLVIAALAIALAAFFPAFEYATLYRGESHPYKFEKSVTASAPAPSPARPATAAPAPTAGTAAPPTGTAAPAAGTAAAPAATTPASGN